MNGVRGIGVSVKPHENMTIGFAPPTLTHPRTTGVILSSQREYSLAGGGWAETNSELSRVLDELDAAASEPPANAVLFQDTRE